MSVRVIYVDGFLMCFVLYFLQFDIHRFSVYGSMSIPWMLWNN